jgi:hypothetical protein
MFSFGDIAIVHALDDSLFDYSQKAVLWGL